MKKLVFKYEGNTVTVTERDDGETGVWFDCADNATAIYLQLLFKGYFIGIDRKHNPNMPLDYVFDFVTKSLMIKEVEYTPEDKPKGAIY